MTKPAIEMKIRGVKATIKNIDELKKGVNDQIDNLLELAGTKFQTRAQELQNAVDTGTGRRSIHVAAPGQNHSGDYEEAYKDAPGDMDPIEKAKKSMRVGPAVQLFIGTWLKYMQTIHRKGGKGGKGKQFLRKAYKETKGPAEKWYAEQLAKLMKHYDISKKRIT